MYHEASRLRLRARGTRRAALHARSVLPHYLAGYFAELWGTCDNRSVETADSPTRVESHKSEVKRVRVILM